MKKFYITLLLIYAVLFVEVYLMMVVFGLPLLSVIRVNFVLSLLCIPASPFMIEQLYDD